jgi:hypothetical protein
VLKHGSLKAKARPDIFLEILRYLEKILELKSRHKFSVEAELDNADSPQKI